MGATADLSGFVICFDFKCDNLALNSGDDSLSTDLQTHRGCGNVLNVQFCANGGLGIIHGFFNRFAGCTFHQSHHTGGSIYQKGTGTNFLCGVFPLHQSGDFTLHSNCNFHRKHILSFFHNTRNYHRCQ